MENLALLWLLIPSGFIALVIFGIGSDMSYIPDPESDKAMFMDNGMSEEDAEWYAYDAQYATKEEYLKRFPNG